jgi:Fe-Mn family superoxide dismutase
MKHMLPPLPYSHAALEPHIDARTMALHHDQHHASYVNKLNAALEAFPGVHGRTALWLLLNLGKVPEKIRTAVHNNAGGHVNHSLMWHAMSPPAGDMPSAPLAEAIDRDFGSLERFIDQFADAGAKLFGSGWVWLATAGHEDGRLQVCTTSGHDNPLMQGRFPILVNDVWEHAYYLKHENRRADYLKGWWPVVNWKEAARRHAYSDRRAGQEWTGEGESALTATA